MMIIPMPYGGIDFSQIENGQKVHECVFFCSPVYAEDDQYLYFGGFLFE